MKRANLVVILTLIVVTPVVTLFILRGNRPDTAQTQPAGPVVVTDTTAYTTRPLKPAEVRAPLLPVALPSDASDIQFAQYSYRQAYELLVSFHAPPESCVDYAKAILIDYNRMNPNRPVPADLTPLTKPPRKYICEEMPTPWFTPETIQTGMKGGEAGSHQPEIWIDSDRGVFYYLLRD